MSLCPPSASSSLSSDRRLATYPLLSGPDGFTRTTNYHHTESSGTHHNMSNDLTEDVIQEYQEAFQLFDKDGNGHIEAKGNTQPQPIVFHRSCG